MHLSVWKSDPEAKRCVRHWTCICEDDVLVPPERYRPYHAACQQRDYAKHIFKDAFKDWDEDECPLFPYCDGATLDGDKVVSFIEAVAELLCEALYFKVGARRVCKHSIRATGAVRLAEIGVEAN